MLQERMIREGAEGVNPLNLKYAATFPPYEPLPKQEGVNRQWEPMAEVAAPPYLCYNRLYFEQLNFERYGWALGVVQPLVSLGEFYIDVATLPYHAAQDPCQRYECNPGYCLPGDPVPLLLYLPEPSLSGTLAEAATVGLLFVAFP